MLRVQERRRQQNAHDRLRGEVLPESTSIAAVRSVGLTIAPRASGTVLARSSFIQSTPDWQRLGSGTSPLAWAIGMRRTRSRPSLGDSSVRSSNPDAALIHGRRHQAA